MASDVPAFNAEESSNDRMLTYAAYFFAAGLLIHTADHFRRGLQLLTPLVYWGVLISFVVAVAVIVLVVMRHRWGAACAVVLGFSAALGAAAAHLLPHWGPLSDSFPDNSAIDVFSYVGVIAEIVSALVLGMAAAYTLWGRRPLSRSGSA